LGNPGTVLPVTVDDAESFAGFGSAGELVVLVATFVTGVVPLTVTTSCRVADDPTPSTPTSQMPVPAL
jgi:hypothetical protein